MLSDALRDLRRTWPQLLLTDLLARTIAALAITPAVGLLLKLFLLRAKQGVLTDEEIALYVLHPIGVAALVIVGAVSLGVVFAEVGALMVVGFGAVEDRRVTWVDALRYVAYHGRELVWLAGRYIVRMLLWAIPFLAALGGIYLFFLGSHDINFYLTDRPPEFQRAVILAGLVVVALGLVVLKKFADWIYALPLVLFEGVSGSRALGESARRTAGRGWKIALAVAGWLAGIVVLSVLVARIVALIGYLLVPAFGGNLAVMALGLTLTLTLAFLGWLAVTVISTTLFPLLIVRFYLRSAHAARLAPTPTTRGTLGERASLRIPGKAILGVASAALVAVAVGGYFLARSVDADDPVEIIAHRGASGEAPENTMASFKLAIADEADWIELDVQENADGIVIVAHDSDFMKVASNGLKIWNATTEDLHDIDIGSWFGAGFSDQRTPTLRQVLELARGQAGVVVELKYYGHDHELESRVVQIIEETRMEASVMIMSLKRAGLLKTAELRPDWTYGLLNTASVGDLTRLDLDFLALNSSAATYRAIRRAHQRGIKVYVWTINDPVRMAVMISRGADGIITDEPAIARQVLELRRHLSPLGRVLIWVAGETGFLRRGEPASTEKDA